MLYFCEIFKVQLDDTFKHTYINNKGILKRKIRGTPYLGKCLTILGGKPHFSNNDSSYKNYILFFFFSMRGSCRYVTNVTLF